MPPQRYTGLSKTRFCYGLQCPKQLWLRVHEPDAAELAVDPALQAVFDRGHRVGEAARKRFPGGVLVDGAYWEVKEKVERTRQAIADGAPAVFEAAFQEDGVFVAVDVLERRRRGFALAEVKSTLEVKETAAAAEATPELAARQARLDAFVERHRGNGYLVGDGLESGRPATAEEIVRLAGRNDDGAPKGLERCRACGSFRGECLAPDCDETGDTTQQVIFVHCRCDNHNRCARCGATLADTRLSAHFYDETARKVLYAAAYIALAHRCRP